MTVCAVLYANCFPPAVPATSIGIGPGTILPELPGSEDEEKNVTPASKPHKVHRLLVELTIPCQELRYFY